MSRSDAAGQRTADGARSGVERLRSGTRRLLSQVRRHPVSVGFAALVLVAATIAGTWRGAVPGQLASGPLSTLQAGRWWTPVTALFVPDSPIDLIFSVALALTALAFAERLLGSRRTAVLLIVAGVAAMLIGSVLETAFSAIPAVEEIDPLDAPVLDPVVAIVGAVTAASALASGVWRRRIRIVVFAVLGMFVLYYGDVDAWYQSVAAVVGLIAGMWIVRDRPRRPWQRSSVRETRSLVALTVAVTGLGPVAALIGGGGRGPLSLVVSEFGQYNDELMRRCAASYLQTCDHQVALLVTRGAGPALLAAVPLVLLVVAAWGLRLGRRAAWVLAVSVNAALAALAVGSLGLGLTIIDTAPSGLVVEWVLWAVSSIGVPVAVVVALWFLRGRFTVRAPRRAVVRLAVTTAVAFVVCVLVFLLIETIFSRAFQVHPSPADLLIEAGRRFIPPAFLDGMGQPPYPRTGPALVVYQWTGTAFWTVFVVAVLRLYRSTVGPAARLAERDPLYGALLRRGGGGTLGVIGMWTGNEHWYSDDMQAAVAYRVIGGVALGVADPVCAPARAGRTIREFTEFCIHHGWTPVFYSIHDDFLPVFDEMGWRWISVGEETVMHLGAIEMAGSAWQKVRHPLRRAEREGMRAVWTSWHELSPSMQAQIVEISERWVADKALPEMGFTLGSLDEIRDPDVALLLAVDLQGQVQAVTSWMPSWQDGVTTGWTLDFMRRRDEAPNGIMEFLIARAALRAQDDGIRILSLSGAPLATKPGDGGAEADRTGLETFLAWLAQVLEPAYGFASLFAFKKKFHPEYRTLYLAYADPMTLGSVGSAIARAYLPNASSREYVALARTMFAAAR